jgi:hypothetical protein
VILSSISVFWKLGNLVGLLLKKTKNYKASPKSKVLSEVVLSVVLVSFTFGNKNNNFLQLGTLLNNEASVCEGFFQIFSMASTFQNFQQFQKLLICA